MEQVGLPAAPSQADAFVADCQDRWEDGGRDQLREALQLAFSQLSLSSELVFQSGPFTLLLLAWLTRHALHPTLLPSAFSSILSQITQQSSTKESQDEATPQAGPSRDVSPSLADPNEQSSTLFISTVLDVVWIVDSEIDARKEMASVQAIEKLLSDEETEQTIDEQTSRARGRLADVVRELLANGIISRSMAGERLELTLLNAIGLVTDPREFNKKAIRINTARLYKQQKFNLLREENEGYSGLINELILGMGPPTIADSPDGADVRVVEQESMEKRNARAQRVMNNISALIGYFDLDPSRVLDVLLDIFSANVVGHWPFFLALLSASPWGHVRRAGEENASMDVDEDVSEHRLGPVDLDISREQGQQTCAQLLGFKFGYYQHPDTKRLVGLDNMYLLAAILIREGQIRFADLYPHLSPDEKGMAKLHEEYKNALSDKAMSAKGNALSMAAPLTEDDGEGSLSNARDGGKKENAEAAPHQPPNQVLGLLKALLAIGQFKHAVLIIGRYPWLCGAYPEVADLFSRLLNVVIEPAYSLVALSTQVEACSGPPTVLQRYRYDVKRQELVPVPPPRLEVTSIAPEPLATGAVRFVYFYNHWMKALPRCSANTVLSDFIPFLRILGSSLIRNPILFQKVCRIGKVAMRAASNRSGEKEAWLEVVRNLLLPALSMTSGNSGLVSEVWVILRQLSYTERYSLYGEWKYSLYRRPELRVRQAEVEKEAKGILKRISSDNVKMSGRSLAKASHANPTIFFTVALNQVQSYSNLIAPIVECAKYLTHFEYDVFGFILIDALSNPEKDRTKQDGTSVSQWLQSLAAFTGTLYRRYAMMDCSPVLQYIANQLKENNVKDLVIIRELVLKMAGIEPLQNLSDSQVAALTGGRLLRMEAMMMANAGIATQTRLALRKSGARLLSALSQSRMAMPLLILIAQQRQACIHLVPDSEAHLKYLGNLFDTCQEILFQYVEFLHNQLEPQAYSDLIPSMADLCRRFEIEPAIASHLVRPRLTLQLRAAQAKENEERLRKELLASQAKKAAEEAAKMDGIDGTEGGKDKDEEEDTEKDSKDTVKSDQVDENVSAEGVAADGGADLTEDIVMANTEEVTSKTELVEEKPNSGDGDKPIWSPALTEAYEAAENALSDHAKDVLGIYFYATFWQLGLSDINVPSDRYQQEIRSLQQIIDENPEGGRKSIPKVRAQAQESIRQLRAELKEQTLSHQATRRRLSVEKDHWFSDQVNRVEIVYALLQECVIPRALLAPTDAVFAGRFLRLMHSNGTRNFASLTVYDKIIMEQVPALIFSTTENEARNLARFLQTVLADLTAWFKDEKRYGSEARGSNLPGFQLKWGDRHGGEEIPPDECLSYEQFKSVVRKWHNMLRWTFVECLTSREYMRIRNCIVVMTRIAQFFPLWEFHGQELLDCIATVSNEEERGDLKILGQGLLATLKKEQRGWIPMPKKKAAPQKDAASSTSAEESKATTSEKAVNGVTAKENVESKKGLLSDDNKSSVRPVSQSRSNSSIKLPVRPEGSRSVRDERVSSAAPSPVPESKTNGDSPSSVQAARQAALDSMREGTMNPPRAPTRDRNVPASFQRNADTSNPTRTRDGAVTPRSLSARSRDPSPQGKDRARSSAQPETRDNSRAPSEETKSKRDQSVPDTHDREHDRSVTKARDNDRASTPSHRDRDSRADRDDRAGRDDRYATARGDRPRERERDRAQRGMSSGRDADKDGNRRSGASNDSRRSRDLERRDRDTDKDRRGRRDADPGQTGKQDESRVPPARPHLAMEQRRPSSQAVNAVPDDRRQDGLAGGRDDRRERERETPQKAVSTPHHQREQLEHRPVPTQPRGVADSETNRQVSSTESPTGSKKRSLADRLSMALEPSSPMEGGQTPTRARDGPNDAPVAGEDQPNKRARTSRGDNDGYDRRTMPHSPRAGDRSGQARGPTGAEEPQGISIHGQGRGGAPPAHVRHPSQQYGRDTFRPGNSASERDRHASSGSSRSDRGRDRERRRRERRSGA